jgi:CubicO group peptidase (beta-lactamase class C family)
VTEAGYLPLLDRERRGARWPDPSRIAAAGTCEWRRRSIHGEVQDENAWAMGGVASHAGLFATVEAVHLLVLEWVRAAAGRGLLLDRRLVTYAWARASGVARGTWALGWDTPSPGASSAGTRVGPSAVGHLGYTGTSVWIDRNRGVHVVLLTNRIACGRSSDAIRALRPRLHDAVFAAVDAERSGR